jgi:hypothetical protein
MCGVSWFTVGVILLFAFPLINGVYKRRKGKPLPNSNILTWIAFCLPGLGIMLDTEASGGNLRAFTIMAVISGVYFLLIHPRLFGRRERSRPPDE